MYNSLINSIFDGVNPYEGAKDKHEDLQGWFEENSPILDLILNHRPKTIIEVGTWKGKSAVKMAKHQKMYCNDGIILCVDTWLGGIDHWLNAKDLLNIVHGRPSIYRIFLANVIKNELTKNILPITLPSNLAAKLLTHHKIMADMIYIDASHEEEDVFRDLVSYYPLLKQDGIFCGDDYSPGWGGVVSAVKRFALRKSMRVKNLGDAKWILIPDPSVCEEPEQSVE